ADIQARTEDLRKLSGGTRSSIERWRRQCVAVGVIRYRPGVGSTHPPCYTVDFERLTGERSTCATTPDASDTATNDLAENGPPENDADDAPETGTSPYRAPSVPKEEEEEPASDSLFRRTEPDAAELNALGAGRIVEAAHAALTGGLPARCVDSAFYAGITREIGELPAERLQAFADELRAYCEAERDGAGRVLWSLQARGVQIYRLLDKHGSAERPAGGRDGSRRRQLRDALRALHTRSSGAPSPDEVVAALRDASLADWARADEAAFDTLTRWCVNWWEDREPQARKLLRDRLDAAVMPRKRSSPPAPPEANQPEEPLLTSEEIARIREDGRRRVSERRDEAAPPTEVGPALDISFGKPSQPHPHPLGASAEVRARFGKLRTLNETHANVIAPRLAQWPRDAAITHLDRLIDGYEGTNA
ncbi:hypothetical protein HOI71_08800, partial [Candidatus Poribacteria bacterium]|nr:hypothetical protein [Candidatus Poribacteria bacterium]